jgi:hypothetical protein
MNYPTFVQDLGEAAAVLYTKLYANARHIIIPTVLEEDDATDHCLLIFSGIMGCAGIAD